MKKLFLLISFVLILTFIGCAGKSGAESPNDKSDNISATQSLESVESAESDAGSEIDAAKIKELENELHSLNAQIADENDKNKALTDKIAALDAELEALRNSPDRTKNIKVKDGVYLTLENESASGTPYLLTIKYKDGTIVEVIKTWYINIIKVSPEGSKVILNDFEMESNAKVFMYDVEKRETKELSVPSVPESKTVAAMEWLDERYFLFVVQYDSGTIARGGDVYIYDTQTDEYKAFIENKNRQFQTHNIDVYGGDYVVFQSFLFDEAFDTAKVKYHMLTHREIYDLVKNSKTFDLSENIK